MQRISITIDDTVKHDLDGITSRGGRAAFVSKAIKKAIDDYHKQQALNKILVFKPYKIDRDSTEVLQEVRESRSAQVTQSSRS